MNQAITVSQHNKNEWSRMAQAAYAARLNDYGHRFSVAASIPNGATLPIRMFDELQADYRAWLRFGFAGLGADVRETV